MEFTIDNLTDKSLFNKCQFYADFAPERNQYLMLNMKATTALVTKKENAKCYITTLLVGYQLYRSLSNETITLLLLSNRISTDFL
jgi:hypothetical protein